nr:hypothetical protein GCM10020092_069010 [Actinoplanes digitatis]
MPGQPRRLGGGDRDQFLERVVVVGRGRPDQFLDHGGMLAAGGLSCPENSVAGPRAAPIASGLRLGEEVLMACMVPGEVAVTASTPEFAAI